MHTGLPNTREARSTASMPWPSTSRAAHSSTWIQRSSGRYDLSSSRSPCDMVIAWAISCRTTRSMSSGGRSAEILIFLALASAVASLCEPVLSINPSPSAGSGTTVHRSPAMTTGLKITSPAWSGALGQCIPSPEDSPAASSPLVGSKGQDRILRSHSPDG